jgi:DNA-binding response OmpR family regulator
LIVADDDAVLRGFLPAILIRAGHDVFVARDGAEAFQLARNFPACLTIPDIQMPRLGGLIACRMIRGLPGWAQKPALWVLGVIRG